MKYKKSSRDSTDVFGTFLSDSSASSATDKVNSSSSAGAASSLTPANPPTEESSAIPVLVYLLEHGDQLAGAIMSVTGLAIPDFFVATESLKALGLIESSMTNDGESLRLTDTGRQRAEYWKTTLLFMNKS